MKEKIAEYGRRWEEATAEEILKDAAPAFPGKLVFASSLGMEDQVITHMIASAKLDIDIFTLDTGRMFQETYSLIDRTREQYHLPIRVIFPDYQKVEQMVNTHGLNLFYESVEKRKLCCQIRKTEPVKRALEGYSAWITGMRRSQSVTRTELPVVLWDEENEMIKINPLATWDLPRVKAYIAEHRIPVNPLHAKGFPSIGCLPCTRAVPPGGDIRDGRWWWEDPEKKECGLHLGGSASGEPA